MILERSIELGVYNSDLILLAPSDSNTLIHTIFHNKQSDDSTDSEQRSFSFRATVELGKFPGSFWRYIE